jgi:large subunit ribosomal protein L23
MSMTRDQYYDSIKAPVLSEKSVDVMGRLNQYVFEVDSKATRTDVKKAIEMAFNVSVVKVNVLNQLGKSKRTRFKAGKRSDVKKAYVTLASGHTIDSIAASS